MQQTYHEQVLVQPGGTIEIKNDAFPEGVIASITITFEAAPEKPARSLLDFRGAGKGCFKSAQEVDDFIRSERDAWGI